jgi:hypothetical protein
VIVDFLEEKAGRALRRALLAREMYGDERAFALICKEILEAPGQGLAAAIQKQMLQKHESPNHSY